MQQCMCAQLYVNISGTCLSFLAICKPNTIYFQGQCIQIVFNKDASPCPQGYLYIQSNCQPKQQCPSPQTLNADTNECLCPSLTFMVNGTCQKCS